MALTAVAAITNGPARASMIGPPLGLGLNMDVRPPVEEAQFFWGGHRYCWYWDGWRGPGWYWCGYRWRRGLGWGGPRGWNNWVYGGLAAPGPDDLIAGRNRSTGSRIPGMGFIGPDGHLQECTVLETGRKRADREALDQARADPVAGDREPIDPEVVAPVGVLVDGLVVVAAADGPHDNAAIPAT